MTPRERAGEPAAPSDHYSYAVYADPAMAGRFDAARFGGPIGTLLAETQERVLVEFLAAAGRTRRARRRHGHGTRGARAGAAGRA